MSIEYAVGIDLGSTTTKAVVLGMDGEVLGRGITNSRSNYDAACKVASGLPCSGLGRFAPSPIIITAALTLCINPKKSILASGIYRITYCYKGSIVETG